MARFYARFDGGTESGLEAAGSNGFFKKLRISDGSTAATTLRNGLIASRSALSTDAYAELDPQWQNGTLGTYFPPETSPGPRSTDSSTFMSWSAVYTSSLSGIKIPTTNRYATSEAVNFSLRPTQSVAYNSPLVGAVNPPDSIGVSYYTYLSASTAVSDVVLYTIVTASNSAITSPWTRPGNYPSRTLYSIWHNPDLNYFAWDDFTPGKPQDLTVEYSASSLVPTFYYTNPFRFKPKWSSSNNNWFYPSDQLEYAVASASFKTGSTQVQGFTETVISPGTQEFTCTVNADPLNGVRCLSEFGVVEGFSYDFLAGVKLRNATLYEETPSVNSDGLGDQITQGVAPITLIRLYGPVYLRKYTSGTVTDYTVYSGESRTSYSTSPNWSGTTPSALTVDVNGIGDRVYETTDSQGPGNSAFDVSSRWCVVTTPGGSCTNSATAWQNVNDEAGLIKSIYTLT